MTAEEQAATPEEAHDKATLGALGEAMYTLTRHPTRAEMWDEALEAMPLAAVSFLATVGTPGERGEIESPLLLVLRSINETLFGWLEASSGSTIFAAVPFAEIDRLGYRVGLAIELAKRGGTVPMEDLGREQAQREQAQREREQGKHEAPAKGPRKAKKKPRRGKP